MTTERQQREDNIKATLESCSYVVTCACFFAGMDAAETTGVVRGVLPAGDDGPAALFRAVGQKLIDLSEDMR